ncbi:hypothetical protein [Acinetobacter equi]|uniref:Lipoprotein n=1 Tax=Acinetobacter equi TaxID=1324350 RepID=A0A0N9VZ20_9GAMM|nr:hypothetical protein [Acinetobacter equi]ALH94502.1 hypothetical protein AOY20_02510 [Acinetobacter equi]
MRLKYLSLCLLSLSFLGCTQHTIQESSKTSPLLEERAVNGLNAIFETSSFDYKGNLKIKSELPVNEDRSKLQNKSDLKLDTELNKKIEQVLNLQKISLSSKEKTQLNIAMAEQINDSAYSNGSIFEQGMFYLFDILNDTQVGYDGSVHYRAQQGSLNLKLEYATPTLEIKAKIPMIIDLKEHKFYVNMFALTPFLANKQQQNSLSYFDFSKYEGAWKDVDVKSLVAFIKQSNALPYVLAEPNALQRIAVSVEEKERGIVEKIRLKSNLESAVTQSLVFNYINGPYLYKNILKQDDETNSSGLSPENIAADIIAQSFENEEAIEDAGDTEFSIYSESWDSSQRIESLINQHLYGEQINVVSVDENCHPDYSDDCRVNDDFDEVDSTSVTEVSISEANLAGSLTEEQCLNLKGSTSKIPLGLVNICYNNYTIRLIESGANHNDAESIFDRSEFLKLFSNAIKVVSIFEPYASTDFTDANAFKELWNNHQVDIQHVLENENRASMTMLTDIGLDAKGRVIDVEYNIEKQDKKYGKINLLSSTQISNYGQATPIDRKKLKDAKSISEQLSNTIFSRSKNEEDVSFENMLEKIALETYLDTGSYIKSYQAVYVLYFAAAKPAFAKYYSANELNEIAELFAYYVYENERPNAQTAKRIKQLQEKHQLSDPSSYGYIGDAVSMILDSALDNIEVDVYWKEFKVQHKTAQDAFAAHYVKVFEDKYEDFTPEEDALLLEVANILGQSYKADLAGKLKLKNISSLREAHEDLIDWDIYRETYREIRTHYK